VLCLDLPNAKEFGGTSEVITEPAATYDFLPTFTGATSEEFEPIKTLSSSLVLCFLLPS
tara:strand:+ start:312 stop:488 length:177 start_codon:yes stop_codon:yes gene_type:complete